jgi:DNA repair photolyase
MPAPPPDPADAGPPAGPRSPPPRGRGTGLRPPNRFAQIHVAPDPDADLGPEHDPADEPSPRTQFFDDASESILSRNDSPDVPFTHGLNPYRGCEHGCAYCYARSYHDYLGWDSGLDFETKILVKRRAPELLRRELSSPRWEPTPVALSGATDCYQPAERRFRLTRACLEVFAELRNPVGVITKNSLVTRDLDLLAELDRWHCATVCLTLTTLDSDLAGALEPRAARPAQRLRAIRALADAGVPVGVMIAPVIPGLTDHEIPALLDAAARHGATFAGKILLRLPHTVKEIFLDWLDVHAPTKKARVVDRIREIRGGELNVADWGKRFRGEGVFAEQIHNLFHLAARRAGLDRVPPELSTAHFRRPGGTQLDLF